MIRSLFLPIILSGCATTKPYEMTPTDRDCAARGGMIVLGEDGVSSCAPTFSADRYDDAHPEEAGLKASTPTDCEPECLFNPDGTGDQ